MKITTQDCIDFIVSQNIPGVQPGVKWKRLSKKNDENKNPLREFQSSNGDLITVKEEKGTGALSIVDKIAQPVNVSDVSLICHPNLKRKLKENAAQIYALEENHLSKIEDLLLPENKECYEQAKEEMEEYFEDGEWDSVLYHISHAIVELQIKSEIEKGLSRYQAMVNVYGVMFDLENVNMEIETLTINGKKYEIAVGDAGGDWEAMICIALYWDVQKDCPVFYVPQEDFNTFNRDTKTAYGSEGEAIEVSREMSKELQDRMIAAEESLAPEQRKKLTLKSLKNHLENSGGKDLNNISTVINKDKKNAISIGDLLDHVKTLPYDKVFESESDNLKYKITDLVRYTIDLQLIKHGYINENNGLALIVCPEIYNKYIKEFGVAFDTENCHFNTRYIENEKGEQVSIIAGEVYGDWEFPVSFAMYFDKSENKVKVYIPLDDFNMFNRLYKTAYGSEGEYFQLPDEEIFRCDDIKENLQEENNSLKDSQRRESLTVVSLENYINKKKG